MSQQWRRLAGAAAAVALLASTAADVCAVPLTVEELAATCANADGLAHCGRLVEEIQLKRLPGLAVRDGDTLHVNLYPAGRTSFSDARDADRSFSLWDYLDPVNAVVLYVAHGDDASFLLLQRTTGRTFEFPAEPKLSPDRQRLLTADFCPSGCRNELTTWRIDRQGVRKEASWAPSERWADASARWKSADAVVVDYTRAADQSSGSIERRLAEPGWVRIATP